MNSLVIVDAGLVSYDECLQFQRQANKRLIAGEGPEILILCQHPAVITLGSSSEAGEILATAELLETLQVRVTKVDRGGKATYHGPGQLIAYPILDLRNKKQDVAWYMRTLESVVIDTVGAFGAVAGTRPAHTGVWFGSENRSDPWRKIASLGVRISRWCTYHGVSICLNKVELAPGIDGFSLINPCGLPDAKMTYLEAEATLPFNIELVRQVFVEKIQQKFNFSEISLSNSLPNFGSMQF